jgi:hypothetical protein
MIKNLASRKADLIAVLIWVAFFFIFLFLTFQRWGDPVIDCGRDPYIAEELLNGKVLYKDFYYPYGPLAPYVLSFLFLAFGIHLNTLYICGAICSLILLSLLYATSRFLLGPFLSAMVVFTCIYECCFNYLLFNYIFPYAYAALFGALFSVAFMFFLARHIRDKKPFDLILCSVFCGLALITKIEFGFALSVLIFIYLLFSHFNNNNITRNTLLAGALPAMIISIIVSLLTVKITGWAEMARHLEYTQVSLKSDASRYILDLQFGWHFFLSTFKDLPDIILYLIVIALFIAIIVTLFNKASVNYYVSTFVILILLGIILTLNFDITAIYDATFMTKYHFLSYIPIISVLIVLYYIYKSFFKKENLDNKDMLVFCIICYTLLINLRNFFSFNIVTYGAFFLPPVLIAIFYYAKRIQEFIANKKPHFKRFNTYWVPFIVTIYVFALFAKPHLLYMTNNTPIITERGTIYTTENQGIPLNYLISYIENNTNENDKILILPEETLIYFLTNRRAAGRFTDYLPIRLVNPELEENLINTIINEDVKLIAISNRSSYENYKYPFWGIDYNRTVMKWLQKNYALCDVTGDYQIKKHFYEGYGFLILQQHCPKGS